MDVKEKTLYAASGANPSYIKPQTEIVELEPAEDINTKGGHGGGPDPGRPSPGGEGGGGGEWPPPGPWPWHRW